jgi:anti-anti-sigma regulatory factor
MTTELRTMGGCVVVGVSADPPTELELELVLRLAERHGKPVVVDLSETGVLPSALVAVLLTALARLEAGHGALVFLLPADPAAEVPRTFAVEGVEDVLPVARTWDDAHARAVMSAARSAAHRN